MARGEWTYRSEYVRCGKGCGGCPHGPYWYRYRRDEGKLHKEYVGKERPAGAAAGERAAPERPRDKYDEMLAPRCADRLRWACAVLNLGPAPSLDDAKRSFRAESMRVHPDRGGEVRKQQAVNAAWSYLRAFFKWK